jgi:hypothetical protein
MFCPTCHAIRSEPGERKSGASPLLLILLIAIPMALVVLKVLGILSFD